MAGLRVLTEEHKKVAEELLRGTPRSRIAAELGVNRSTLYRWMRDPLWLAYYSALSEEVESARMQRLLPVAMAAAEAVEASLSNAIRDLGDDDPAIQSRAPGLETLARALKTVVELDRVDRGKPSDIKELRKDKDGGAKPLSNAAKKLVKDLDNMVKAEEAAGVHNADELPTGENTH